MPANKLAEWEKVEAITSVPAAIRRDEQRELMDADVDLAKFALDPRRAGVKSIDVVDSIIGGEIERSIETSSTVTVTLRDADRKLLRSGLFEVDEDDKLARIDIKMDGLTFRLVKVEKQGNDLLLTFEDIEVNVQRRGRGKPIKARRGKLNRAEFILRMLREVKGRRIRFHCPELHQDQPIQQPRGKKSKRKRAKDKDDNRSKGVSRGARLTVKGKNANSEQLNNIGEVLEQAEKDKAPRVVMIAVVAATINETTILNKKFQNVGSGDLDSVGILQLRVKYHGLATARSIAKSVHLFVTKKGGFTGQTQGSALDMAKRGASAAAIAGSVMNNIGPSMYGKWVAEATRIVDSWLGGDINKGSGGRKITVDKPYDFRRNREETSWEAAQRLAEEVRWRLFVVSGTYYYMSETRLFKSRARHVISEDTDGVDNIDFDWDQGKTIAEVTVSCRIHRWTAPPGSVVVIEKSGPVNGRWLVSTVRRPLFSAAGEITLRKPLNAKPEPASDTEDVEFGTKGGTGGSGTKSGGKATGNLDWPVRGPVTSPFGQRAGRLHDGIDIGVSFVPCHAADGGRVTVAGANGGYGLYVAIDHGGGLLTFYGHLSKVSVRSGQNVNKGEVIGTTGNTGHSTGPHLHFGVHKGGSPVDPARYL